MYYGSVYLHPYDLSSKEINAKDLEADHSMLAVLAPFTATIQYH